MTRVNRKRVSSVACALRGVRVECVRVTEERDPQFLAARRLVDVLGAHAVAAMVANALVSYRLSMTGEEYWTRYSLFIVECRPSTPDELVECVASFLDSISAPLKRQKVARLAKFRSIISELWREPMRFRRLTLLFDALRTVDGRRYSKTIVFAVKMAYYAYRALSVPVESLGDIPMPIDSRIATVTYTSGIMDEHPDSIMRDAAEAAEAWHWVSREAGLPPLHIDTLVWLAVRDLRSILKQGLVRARVEVARRIVETTNGCIDRVTSEMVARELLWRSLPRL